MRPGMMRRDYCVEDELKLVENYAVIQKARFMNFELDDREG